MCHKFEAIPCEEQSFLNPSDTQWRYTNDMSVLVKKHSPPAKLFIVLHTNKIKLNIFKLCSSDLLFVIQITENLSRAVTYIRNQQP